MRRRVKLVLARRFVAVVGACAAGAYAVLSANPRVTNAHVTGVALTPDRKTIVVQVAGYHSGSCNSFDPTVQRSGKKWTVRVRSNASATCAPWRRAPTPRARRAGPVRPVR